MVNLLRNLNRKEAAILATILYYDLLNYALTSEEIFMNLIGEKFLNYSDFLDSLSQMVSMEALSQKDGLYFLEGREDLSDIRYLRNAEADWKWKKLFRVVRWFRLIPFVEGIVGSGSLALGNTRKDSDLDLLVLTKPHRIWTTRVLVSGLTSFLGVRRHDDVWQNRVCLNHYKTTDSLLMKHQSLYNAQVYIHWFPLLNFSLFKKLQEENKKWIREYVPNFSLSEVIDKRVVEEGNLMNINRRFFEFVLGGRFGDWIEKKLKHAQIKRIEKKGGKEVKGGRIVLEDDELSFHPDSPERKIIDDFNRRSREMGLKNDWRDSGLG